MASDPIWKLTFFPNGKQRYLLTAEEAKSFYHIKNTSKTYEFFTISIDAPILPIRKIEPRQCGGLAKVTEQARDGGRSGIQVHPSASSTMHCDDTTHYITFLLATLFVYLFICLQNYNTLLQSPVKQSFCLYTCQCVYLSIFKYKQLKK